MISYLQKEDASYLLQESGYKIILESSPTTTFLEPGGDATFNVASTTGGGFWQTIVGVPTIVTDFVHGAHIKSTKFAPNLGQKVVTPQGVLADAGSRISLYLYINALPTGGDATFLQVQTSGGSTCFMLTIGTTGILKLYDASFAQIGTNGKTFSTGVWYRICLTYTVTDTTHNRFEIFVDAVSTISVTNGTITASGTNRIIFGNNDTNAALDLRLSDVYVDNSSSLTDTGDVWVTAKRPNANGTANNFSTQIGAGGSGYGTGHSPQVNERALSTTNGWSMIGAGSAITEEYSIESLSQGDIDLTGATIGDYMGWVYASAALSETGQIVVDNINTNISLTSTNTMFTKYAGSATYPNGGEDIGIVTSTTVTTVSLYECGIIFAYTPFVASTSRQDQLMLMGVS